MVVWIRMGIEEVERSGWIGGIFWRLNLWFGVCGDVCGVRERVI